MRISNAVSGLMTIVAAAYLAASAAAQPQSESATVRRPKVALVLSGGGALGVAHVGVIQELERMGIRPDLVVGTSMGAVVGGLYSAGYTGDELENIVTTIDWQRVFDDTPPRDGLSFRQKSDQADFPVKARFRVKDGRLSMPSGLVSDQNLLLTLRDLIGAKGIAANFDSLPIPFRCIAADIETGKPVVLESGDLASAIRASFSVPGVLPPMSYKDHLLVDGGLAMNIPVEIAQGMGADVLIVVKLSNRLKTKDEIKTVVDVASQTISLLILQNEQAQLAKMRADDILVDVDLANYGSTSFEKSHELVAPGRRAVVANRDRLARLGQGKTVVASSAAQPVIDFVRIANTSTLDDDVIAARLDIQTGRPLDAEQLNRDLTEIYALGAFERVDYGFVKEDGRTGLEIRAIEREGGVDYLRAALSLETNFDGEAGYAFSFDYTAAAIDSLGAEWRLEGVIGDRLRLYTEYFQPLDASQGWFVMPRLGVQAFDAPLYDSSGFKLAEFRAYFGSASLEAGRQFGDWGEVRIGLERGLGRAELSEGVAPLGNLDVDIGRVFVSGGLDTLDEPYFATKGARAAARWTQAFESLGSSEDYQTIGADIGHAMSWGDHRLILSAAGGTTLQGDVPVEALFRLGGPFSLSGFERDELTGEAFIRAGALYAVKLNDAEPRFFGVPLYAGASLETGNTWADRRDVAAHDLIAAGSVFVGADTLLGPAFLGYGRAEGDRQSVFLFIGRPF